MDAAGRRGDCLLDVLGPTPVVRLQRVRPEGGAEIWVKLEHLLPSGSVEDRVGDALLDAGPIRASPDRAIAVALAARVRGTAAEVSLTASPTHEQREMLRLLGVEVVPQASTVDATDAFRRTLGAELAAWARTAEGLSLIVAPAFLAAALDQAGVPVLVAPDVPAAEAAAMASRLAREEGLLVGPSTGANVAAAFHAASTRAPSEAVLAFALDSGERYFSASMEPRG